MEWADKTRQAGGAKPRRRIPRRRGAPCCRFACCAPMVDGSAEWAAADSRRQPFAAIEEGREDLLEGLSGSHAIRPWGLTLGRARSSIRAASGGCRHLTSSLSLPAPVPVTSLAGGPCHPAMRPTSRGCEPLCRQARGRRLAAGGFSTRSRPCGRLRIVRHPIRAWLPLLGRTRVTDAGPSCHHGQTGVTLTVPLHDPVQFEPPPPVAPPTTADLIIGFSGVPA
jgi:hypothetical protein